MMDWGCSSQGTGTSKRQSLQGLRVELAESSKVVHYGEQGIEGPAIGIVPNAMCAGLGLRARPLSPDCAVSRSFEPPAKARICLIREPVCEEQATASVPPWFRGVQTLPTGAR